MLKGQQFSFTKTCIERVKCFSENPWVMNKTSSRFKLEVIPFKLFYYQTCFETWHNRHSWIWTWKKKRNKKMGLPCLFTRQQALILGYFYLVRVTKSNPLLTELSLCYSKHTKFYLEHKTSFIQISSIASFNSFLIAWLWGYCTFSHSSVVSLKSSPWPKHTKCETIFPQKIVLLSFFFLKYAIY